MTNMNTAEQGGNFGKPEVALSKSIKTPSSQANATISPYNLRKFAQAHTVISRLAHINVLSLTQSMMLIYHIHACTYVYITVALHNSFSDTAM